MTKKYFLSLLALMFCFNAFSQTTISTKEEFLAINNSNTTRSGNYIQTANIYLGDLGTQTSSIISSFSGNYDGGGFTITYQANFNTSDNSHNALFGSVTGTITNLNVNATVTATGGTSSRNVALLCGLLNGGTIRYCTVSGSINNATQGWGGGCQTGLLVGTCRGRGTIEYCSGNGNVTGYGYVGGLVGDMESGTISYCAFTGNVTANSPWMSVGGGGFAGGICGNADDGTTIRNCSVVNSDIVGATRESGIASTNGDSPTVKDCYYNGTAENGFTNSDNNENRGNMSSYSDNTVPNLNYGIGDNADARFESVGGQVVLVIGSVCKVPTILSVSTSNGESCATWNNLNTSNDKFYYTLSGGSYTEIASGIISETTACAPLSPHPVDYVFTIRAYCNANADGTNGIYSEEKSYTFEVPCPKPTNFTITDITDNSFKVNWTATAKSILTVNGTSYEYQQAGTYSKIIENLNPETNYSVEIKVECTSQYYESETRTATTLRLPAPTGLTTNVTWNQTSGTVEVTWNTISGLEYEIEGEGVQQSGFTKTGLNVGSYTVKVRARKGDKYSDWVSMPYTVSAPKAPSNPIVTFSDGGASANVTITWTQGSENPTSWTLREGSSTIGTSVTTQTPTYTYQNKQRGSSFTVNISETSPMGTSADLPVNITVPCLPATLPTNIATTHTTATLTFATTHTNRKVFIGNDEYSANNTTLTITNLSSGTNYNYRVEEYCSTTVYSEETGNFATVSCQTVASMQATATGITTATASWTSQSTLQGLSFKVRLLQNNIQISSTEQTTTTIDFTNLQPSTTYTVEVSEQCGNGYGDVRTINFTTQSAEFTTCQSGEFNSATIWVDGRVPTGNIANITIAQGHRIIVNHDLILTDTYKIISNQGVIAINGGQLINTSANNVGGIIEVSTSIKDQNNWNFFGAPFANYKLEVVKPFSGSDIAVCKYNYSAGAWADNAWATPDTSMSSGEGAFAYQFYDGTISFTTYGDLGEAIDYTFPATAKYQLNNGNVSVTHSLVNSEGGYWMPLSNPYPAKLSVSKFLADNTSIQGLATYKYENNSFQLVTSGEIKITEGFFVNYSSSGSHTANFKKTQLTNYPTTAKSEVAPREFIELALVNGDESVKVYFAQNEEAEQEYDIYDANKMFATMGAAEPYLLTDGIALIKEEVKTLPYYATMNVRSEDNAEMNFVLNNLPDGYAVSIIDGDNVIDMAEGSIYTTQISVGDNENRFKLLVKKNVGLAEVEELDVRITNSNRHVSLQTAETNLNIEVYNTLGQKVYETKEHNFILKGVSAGVYMIKAFNQSGSKTTKIVVK